MFMTKINLYSLKFSPPCQAVLMTAKQLNIDLNVKDIDLSEGQHMTEEYLNINPTHTVPTIDDNGFILWESRAIMQYLCNEYAPESSLYPKCPKQRALVDQWLNSDLTLFNLSREAIAKPLFGIPVSEELQKTFKEKIESLDQLIYDKKYLVGQHLTIADISVLATTHSMLTFILELGDYPNLKRWVTDLTSDLSYFKEVIDFEPEDLVTFTLKMREYFAKQLQQAK